MPPELRDEVREWLDKAGRDLRAAEVLVAADPVLRGIACLHCQQVAEKSLKAFLAWRQTAFRKSHELRYLLRLCAATEPGFQGLREAAETLTPYAQDFRYPGRRTDPSPDETGRALQLAREVLAFVLERLPDEVRTP